MTTPLNIEEILICLKNTYKSPDKKVREESEKKLSELKNQNIVSFSTQLIDLLKLPSQELDNNLRMSIILQLKRSIKEKIENDLLDLDSCNQLIQLFITIIVNPMMIRKEIENLKETFISLLNNTTVDILIEIIKYINEQISSMPLGSVNGVITILLSIIQISSLDKKKFLIILDGVLNMSSLILENLYNKYENINLENNMDDYLKINSIFLSMFDLFFLCSGKLYKKYNIKNEKFFNIFDNILIIGAKILVNLKAKDNNRIISWTGDKKLDKNINNMKITIFKYINIQLNSLGDFIMDKTKIENHNQIIKIIMSNLEWVIMNKYTYLIKLESDANYPDYGYSLIITYMLLYLRRILYKDNYIIDYTNIFNSMYKNILLPLLIISDIEEEIAIDNDSVNGYLIDINDVIYESKQKKIKSAISGLIKKIYEKNMKSNEFMLKYTIGLLYNLINNSNNLEDKTLYDQNDIIILLQKAYPKEKIIYALFLALNIFSETDDYKNKEQNEKALSDFFQNLFENFISKINIPILKHQIILFIRNYTLRFYEPDSIAFETTVKYLFDSLFDEKNLLISNSAADAIQSIFTDKPENEDFDTVKETILKVANCCSANFEKQILEIQISNFFDVLYQIMNNFEKTDNQFFQNIFVNLCKRVNVEVERHYRLKFIVKKEKNKAKKKATQQTKLNDYKIIINKCFNIIRMLINNKRFVSKNIELIENSLKPLVAYMEDPKKIDFDEDIIYIIYMIIIHLQKLTGLSFSLIKHLYKYVDKIGGILLDLYELINAYLAYGSDQILCNKIWYEGIFSVFNSGIKGKNYDKSPFYSCILAQTWAIYCKKLPTENFSQLINNVVNNINQIMVNYNENKKLGEDKYNFLGYITLILCSLINYSQIVIPALQKTNNEDSLKNWLKIIIDENEIIFEYEIKIIIYSICLIIKNGIITGDIDYLLNISKDLLICQETNAKFGLKKNTKKALNIAFVEDDEEEDEKSKDDESENEDEEYKEINELVKKTINPVKDMDEFLNFKDLLNYLKNNKNEIFTSWENSLNEDEKKEISQLIGTKRINIQLNKNNSMQVPRRIVSIRRNQK